MRPRRASPLEQPPARRTRPPTPGRFADEIVAARRARRRDECVRPAHHARGPRRPEAAPSTTPAMAERFPQIDWRVTAGNSSPINDGSAAAADHHQRDRARARPRPPKARLHSFAVVGDDPLLMLTGVIPATAKVLRQRRACRSATSTCSRSTRRSPRVVLAWQRETGADLGQGQRERRRDRARPPARRQRRPPD